MWTFFFFLNIRRDLRLTFMKQRSLKTCNGIIFTAKNDFSILCYFLLMLTSKVKNLSIHYLDHMARKFEQNVQSICTKLAFFYLLVISSDLLLSSKNLFWENSQEFKHKKTHRCLQFIYHVYRRITRNPK